MELHSYIAARWGSPAGRPLDSDQLGTVAARNAQLWRNVAAVSHTTAPEPSIEGVHSVRALPALLKHRGQSTILWDAGLGTLLDLFSYQLPHPQPAGVAESLVRRVCSVRLLAAGRAAGAKWQAAEAARLLAENPIDRHHEYNSDPESQFSVWLATELQERFVLAHEQMHYLKSVDEGAFDRLKELLSVALGDSDLLGLNEESPLQGSFSDSTDEDALDHYTHRWIELSMDRNLDCDAWYLKSWRDGTATIGSITEWEEKLNRARAALDEPGIADEVVCDVFGALAVCLDSHTRQRGWDATSAAASTRVALESLGMIFRIDSMLSISSGGHHSTVLDIGRRAECMELALPLILDHALPELGPSTLSEPVPCQADMREVMRLAGQRGSELYSPALALLQQDIAANDDRVEFPTRDLALPGFSYERPASDWKASWAFELGVVDTSPAITSLVRNNPEAWTDINMLLQRHLRGDWGDLPAEDAAENEKSLWREFEHDDTGEAMGRRRPLYSMYRYGQLSVLVVTSADRALTTVLTIGEY